MTSAHDNRAGDKGKKRPAKTIAYEAIERNPRVKCSEVEQLVRAEGHESFSPSTFRNALCAFRKAHPDVEPRTKRTTKTQKETLLYRYARRLPSLTLEQRTRAVDELSRFSATGKLSEEARKYFIGLGLDLAKIEAECLLDEEYKPRSEQHARDCEACASGYLRHLTRSHQSENDGFVIVCKDGRLIPLTAEQVEEFVAERLDTDGLRIEAADDEDENEEKTRPLNSPDEDVSEREGRTNRKTPRRGKQKPDGDCWSSEDRRC